jgi:hypothetical protein
MRGKEPASAAAGQRCRKLEFRQWLRNSSELGSFGSSCVEQFDELFEVEEFEVDHATLECYAQQYPFMEQ